MPTFRQFKYWYIVYIFPAVIALGIVTALVKTCGELPNAERQYRVHSDRGFNRSIKTAMGYINRSAGCVLLVEGSADDYSIKFLAMTDTPCSVKALHEGIQTGHTAGTYECPDTVSWDIDVEKPGDIHLIVCIAMHEMMHALGFDDSDYGIMNPYDKCEGIVWPSDVETKQLKTLCD